MNPKPSLYQCLVLHEIADGRVWRREPAFEPGDWWLTGSHRDHKVSLQVKVLCRLGLALIKLTSDGGLKVEVTTYGRQVIERRPLVELLEALNRR